MANALLRAGQRIKRIINKFRRPAIFQLNIEGLTASKKSSFAIYLGEYVLAKKHGGVHPILYALLPNKRCATYVCVFQLLHDKIPGLYQKAISCYFEQVAISAMEECFPGVTIGGCFFHLVHNVHKQLKQIGLQGLRNSNPDFALSAKMITVLCLVPVPHLNIYIDALSAAPINSRLKVVMQSPTPFGLGRNGCWPSPGSQLPWALPSHNHFFAMLPPERPQNGSTQILQNRSPVFSVSLLLLFSSPSLSPHSSFSLDER